MFSRLRSLLTALLRSRSLNREIDEELRFHCEARTEDLVRRGMERGAAEWQARIELGATAAHREEMRASHGLRLFDYLRQEFGQAIRTLRRNPAFSLSIVGLIALGVGSNVAIFSVVDAVLFRPPPFAEPERLVSINGAGSRNGWISLPEYQTLKTRSDLFTGTAAYVRDLVTVTGANEPDQVYAVRATGQLFSVLGVRALLGRMIEESDEIQRTRAAVISRRLWQRQFDGNTDVLGKTISLSGELFTVVGVMRPEIEFPVSNVDVWIPLDTAPDSRYFLTAIARLKDGVTLSAVQSAMDVFAAQIRQEDPQKDANVLLAAPPWRQSVEPAYELTMMLIFAAFGCVLLIACGNVAGLLLGRAAQRQREIAIRGALGAGPWRIARGLLAESLMLSALGSVLGLIAAHQALRLLSKLLARLPIVLPHLQFVELNARGVTASVLLCLAVACLCSLAPILFAAGAPARAALRSGERTGSKASRPLFSFLVASQAAFACFLLVGSGLMLHSVVHLQNADKGFKPENILALSVPTGTMRGPRPTGKETQPQIAAYYERLLEQVERINGPGSAALVSNLPLSGINMTLAFPGADGETIGLSATSVSSQYFAVMGVPLVSGRLFTPAERDGSAPVVVVNERLASEMFPGQSAVGQYLPVSQEAKIRIVGVVKDSWQSKYDQPIAGEIYLPYEQAIRWAFASTIVIRTDRDSRTTAEALQRAIWAVDPNQPITRIRGMDAILSDAIWRPRFSAWAFSLLGLIALLLSALGTYAVVNYTSALRMREVGIRMCVGATARDVVRLVVAEAMRPLAIGLAVGGLATLGLARFLSSVLYETSSWEPEAYLGAAAVMLAASVIASFLPALRAASADPVSVLRAE
ncbi:MAG: ABC transporter permease [Acidobacteria bacterium]|nr:ABC transporter permease [Acidobacteriota bacterium]MDA1233452.1 ABC transporter permease [Acidobacteriota bacterium]